MNTFAQEYVGVLDQILNMPDFTCKPRDMEIKEIIPGEVHIDPVHCFFRNSKRDFGKIVKYIVGETMWYFAGRNDTAFIEKYAKMWTSIKNDDGTANSAYGNLLFTMKDAKSEYQVSDGKSQWEWAYDSLVADKDTRQAIMHFNRPIHQTMTRDFVCTLYTNFHIRNNKLSMISRMRSQDVFKGLTYDVPFFSMLLQNMYLLLKKNKYPELELGTLTHSSDSLHIYSSDYDLAREMLKHETEDIMIELPAPLVDEHGRVTNLYGDIVVTAQSSQQVQEAHERAFVIMGGKP